ncbi:TIGR03899 family protein [Photobacterium sp. 1_MG-2023]|uniref:TIGR03899 family protein n=1 Tax=Photobacterium sp. 1_MG-2023 TaxID=3062646 RepID=UPI0026E160EB|nr:TIGR03899 family protein [Photobacterium sp. 1_MG-2023]MDO6707673.1 TIGR03899 family protein [Photobacterium sp. 1_MG-2023]
MGTESQVNPQPVEVVSATEKKSSTKNTVKSSRFRIQSLARHHAVGAQIDDDHDKTLQERTENRQQKQLQRQQQNLERIFKLGYESCLDETAGEPDPDWMHHFIAITQDIYSPPMQKLWSRILRQEVISPGSISLKAMTTLKQMTQRDAQLFRRACMLSCHFGQDNSKKLLTGVKFKTGLFRQLKQPSIDKLNLGYFSLPYSHLLELMELGLILNTELESGQLQRDLALHFYYQGSQYQLQPTKYGLSLLYYRLSPVGQEIAQLLGNQRHDEYKTSLIELLNKHFIVTHDSADADYIV